MLEVIAFEPVNFHKMHICTQKMSYFRDFSGVFSGFGIHICKGVPFMGSVCASFRSASNFINIFICVFPCLLVFLPFISLFYTFLLFMSFQFRFFYFLLRSGFDSFFLLFDLENIFELKSLFFLIYSFMVLGGNASVLCFIRDLSYKN
jgi:hypothetical protein